MIKAADLQLSDPAAHAIFNATKVLMFFGTLHRELLTEDILSMAHAENDGENAKLFQSVDRSSGDLQSQLLRFIDIASHFRIFSFYELRQLKKLVEVRLTL